MWCKMPKDWSNNKKIVFLVVPILLYLGLISVLAIEFMSEFYFVFFYLVGSSLLVIKLQKESLRQRLVSGKSRRRIYSIMCFILPLYPILLALVFYFQADIQFINYMAPIFLAPIGEEIFFRGYVQGNFERFFKPYKNKKAKLIATSVAVVVTSLLFSLAHIFRYFKGEDSSIFSSTFFTSIIFYGSSMALYKSIFVPISLHMLQNLKVTLSEMNMAPFPELIYLSMFVIIFSIPLFPMLSKSIRARKRHAKTFRHKN